MSRQKQVNKWMLPVLVAAIALACSSCNRNVVYREYQTFKGLEWHASDTAVFNVDITDTTTLNNISLMVRHSDSYPYNNIFLFVTTMYPDGKVLKDTMEVVLASSSGEWLGSGMGDIFDFKVPVKKNIRFPRSGRYTFVFRQAMRVDPLPLVMDFGFEVEKVKKEN
jgi:gliding motility-associated lipoprotein GldH